MRTLGAYAVYLRTVAPSATVSRARPSGRTHVKKPSFVISSNVCFGQIMTQSLGMNFDSEPGVALQVTPITSSSSLPPAAVSTIA